MKREFLRGLGIEEEQIQKILDEHHDSLQKYRDKADKVETLTEQLETANTEIKERDAQITELQSKSGDNEELNKQLEEYKQSNADYEQKLKDVQLNNAIKLAAVEKGANDPNDVLTLMDKSTLELQEDGTVKGLDEAMGNMAENKPYYFEVPKPTGRTPQEGGNPEQAKPQEAWTEFLN